MEDFVVLLKSKIDKHSKTTPELRRQVYAHVLEVFENKLSTTSISYAKARLYYKLIEKSINKVEELYSKPTVYQTEQDFQEETDQFFDRKRKSFISHVVNNSGKDLESLEKKNLLGRGEPFLVETDNEQVSAHLPDIPLFVESKGLSSTKDVPLFPVQSSLNQERSDFQKIQTFEGSLSFDSSRVDSDKRGAIPDFLLKGRELSDSSVEESDRDRFYGSFFKELSDFLSQIDDVDRNPQSFLSKELEVSEETLHMKEDSEDSLLREKNAPFMIAGILAQAAARKKRLDKEKLLAYVAIASTCFVMSCVVIWFMIGLFSSKEEARFVHSGVLESLVGEKPFKAPWRLMPDGEETASLEDKPSVIFREAQTDIFPEIVETGKVTWSLLYEESPKEMMIRGDISIPKKKMMLRMTIRRNYDYSIPAGYLIELIFVLPENFDGGAVDRIGPLLFKNSENSMGKALEGTFPVKIADNFFILAMNSSKAFLSRNLNIMRRLSWMKLNIVYKNGRIGELSFAKGDVGDFLFKKVFDDKNLIKGREGSGLKESS